MYLLKSKMSKHIHTHIFTRTHSYKMQTLTDVTSYYEKEKEAFKIKWSAGNTVQVSAAFDTI